MLRLGETPFTCGEPDVRARELVADRAAGARSRKDKERLTAPERDGAAGRGSALEAAWVSGLPVASARDGRSGLTDGVGALRCISLAEARSEADEERREVVAREGG